MNGSLSTLLSDILSLFYQAHLEDITCFRHVSAENTLTAVITVSSILRHFIFLSYGFGVSAKNPFRSHTKLSLSLHDNQGLSKVIVEIVLRINV